VVFWRQKLFAQAGLQAFYVLEMRLRLVDVDPDRRHDGPGDLKRRRQPSIDTSSGGKPSPPA
jgi:hypothetical protein